MKPMLPLAVDETFNDDIVRGLLRRDPALDLVRVQDAGLSGADDSSVLEWAASQNRGLLTHDVSTISRHAYKRLEAGKRMPGVIEVRRSLRISRAIEDILLLAEVSRENEWEGQLLVLPLR